MLSIFFWEPLVSASTSVYTHTSLFATLFSRVRNSFAKLVRNPQPFSTCPSQFANLQYGTVSSLQKAISPSRENELVQRTNSTWNNKEAAWLNLERMKSFHQDDVWNTHRIWLATWILLKILLFFSSELCCSFSCALVPVIQQEMREEKEFQRFNWENSYS